MLKQLSVSGAKATWANFAKLFEMFQGLLIKLAFYYNSLHENAQRITTVCLSVCFYVIMRLVWTENDTDCQTDKDRA